MPSDAFPEKLAVNLKRWAWDRPVIVLLVLLPAIVVPHLLDLGYWASDPETLIITGATLGLGMLCVPIELKFPKLGSFAIAFCLYWLSDAFFDPHGLVSLLLLGGAAIVSMSRLGADFRRATIVFSIVWMAMNFVHLPGPTVVPSISSSSLPVRTKGLPTLIHLVLDEQGSPAVAATFDVDGYSSEALAHEFVGREFRVHFQAVSNSHLSRLSLSQLVSLRSDSKWMNMSRRELFEEERSLVPSQDLFRMLDEKNARVAENRYFARLHELGYSITTVQSSYLQYCIVQPAEGDICHTYEIAGNGHSQSTLAGALRDKLILAAASILFDYQRAGSGHDVVFVRAVWKAAGMPVVNTHLSRPAHMVSILSDLERQLENPQPGRAYFVHLMLPHRPFVLGSDCQLNPMEEWVEDELLTPGLESRPPYAAYLQQSECSFKRVLSIVDTIRSTANGAEAIFFIHGDHGSRISHPMAEWGRHDHTPEMRSTLLAVKAPNALPGLSERPIKLQNAFHELFQQLADCIGRQGRQGEGLERLACERH